MVNTQMARNPAQAQPIHVQLNRFVAHLVRIGPGFGLWSVLDLAVHAAIALAAAVRFPSSVLTFRSVTLGTFNHLFIIAQLLATPIIIQQMASCDFVHRYSFGHRLEYRLCKGGDLWGR